MIPLRDSIRSETVPFVNYLLIFLNIVFFFLETKVELAGDLQDLLFAYGVVPSSLLGDPGQFAHTLISSQFLHGSFMHLAGNMLFLYIFGDNVEDRFGHFKYLLFYLFSGLLAALTQVYFHQNSTMPMIGASGAIAGVLGSYFLFYPKATVLTLIPLGFFSRIVEIPAFFFLGLWFVLQTFSGTAALYTARSLGREVGGVAWWAHAGGFAAGLFFAFAKRILEGGKRGRA